VIYFQPRSIAGLAAGQKIAHLKILIILFSILEALKQRLIVCTLRFMLDFENLAITIFE